jgi:hypothetical protein
MNQINQQVEIQWPVTALFNYVSDITNNAAWQDEVIKSEWINRTDNRVGSTFSEIRKMNGSEVEAQIKITEFIPNKKRTVKIGKDKNLLCSMDFIPVTEEQTRVVMKLQWKQGPPVDKILGESQNDLLRLKEVLEKE